MRVFRILCRFLVEVCFVSPYRLYKKDQADIALLHNKITRLEDDTLRLIIEPAPGPVEDAFGGWIFGVFVSHGHQTRTATDLRVSIRQMKVVSEDGTEEPVSVHLPRNLHSYDEPDYQEIPPISKKGYEVLRISGGVVRSAFDNEMPLVNIMKDTVKTMTIDVFASAKNAVPATRQIFVRIPSPGIEGCPSPTYVDRAPQQI